MNGTQNAPAGASQFKPGDRVRHLNISGDLEIVAVVDGRAWVRNPENHSEDWVLMVDGDFLPAPAHPIPSEPNTAWVDKGGDVWVVPHGGKLIPNGNPFFWGKAADYAPFTRLVPEGSEREAAIREVVEWMKGFTCIKCDQGIKQVELHFLSGVDQ